MVQIPCLFDVPFTLKEVDLLKHSQPILDEAASTDLGSKIRRRSDLPADGQPRVDLMYLIHEDSLIDH